LRRTPLRQRALEWPLAARRRELGRPCLVTPRGAASGDAAALVETALHETAHALAYRHDLTPPPSHLGAAVEQGGPA
jgi:hypothetical protein